MQFPTTSRLLTTALLLLVIDIPWLLLNSSSAQSWIREIQSGEAPYFRLWAAVPVYIALAWLLLQATSPEQAALLGLSTYAVYDFTNLTIFKRYPLFTAITDTLWGGFLFWAAFSVVSRV